MENKKKKIFFTVKYFTAQELENFKKIPVTTRLLWLEEANKLVAKRFPVEDILKAAGKI